jgi:hypothetical protein
MYSAAADKPLLGHTEKPLPARQQPKKPGWANLLGHSSILQGSIISKILSKSGVGIHWHKAVTVKVQQHRAPVMFAAPAVKDPNPDPDVEGRPLLPPSLPLPLLLPQRDTPPTVALTGRLLLTPLTPAAAPTGV